MEPIVIFGLAIEYLGATYFNEFSDFMVDDLNSGKNDDKDRITINKKQLQFQMCKIENMNINYRVLFLHNVVGLFADVSRTGVDSFSHIFKLLYWKYFIPLLYFAFIFSWEGNLVHLADEIVNINFTITVVTTFNEMRSLAGTETASRRA